MRRATRWLGLLLTFIVVLDVPRSAAGDSGDRLDQAKKLFREGVSQLNAGDPERALESFQRSREIVPSGKNTANAAICLERLGRYDEALELYEQLLSQFSADLDSQDQTNLVPTMAALRERLASLDVSANVAGSLIIDDKPRGSLPRTTLLRVLPGQRRIRIEKKGFRTFEKILELRAGQTQVLDAELEPEVEQSPKAVTSRMAMSKAVRAAATAAPTTEQSPGVLARRWPAFAAGGLGLVGVGVGTMFGLRSISKHDESEQFCDGQACTDQRGVDLRGEAQAAGNLSTLGFVVGGVGLTTAAVLWFALDSAKEPRAAKVSLGLGNVRLEGQW